MNKHQKISPSNTNRPSSRLIKIMDESSSLSESALDRAEQLVKHDRAYREEQKAKREAARKS